MARELLCLRAPTLACRESVVLLSSTNLTLEYNHYKKDRHFPSNRDTPDLKGKIFDGRGNII